MSSLMKMGQQSYDQLSSRSEPQFSHLEMGLAVLCDWVIVNGYLYMLPLTVGVLVEWRPGSGVRHVEV